MIQTLEEYILTHAKVMSDGTIYVVTPNGNWVRKDKFIAKYS